jgi:hypothetical protein
LYFYLGDIADYEKTVVQSRLAQAAGRYQLRITKLLAPHPSPQAMNRAAKWRRQQKNETEKVQ